MPNPIAPTPGLPDEATTRMFREAGQAPAVVGAQLQTNQALVARLGETLRWLSPRAVVTCARGSSDHAATFAKYLIETRAGVIVASAAPSISSVYGASPKLDRVLFLAISQSGKSPDLMATVEAAKAAGAFVLALVNVADSPLAQIADEVLPLHAGPETSVAATKSYIGTLSALIHLVTEWTQDRDLGAALDEAPMLLERAWGCDWNAVVGRLTTANNLYVIGRGIGFGVALEAALKLKETCGLHAEAFSAAEVRHGPMALVKPGFPLLVFRQYDETGIGVDDLANDLAKRGGDVLLAGSALPGVAVLPVIEAHPVLEPVLQIQSFYRAANRLSLMRGYDPDRPPHLAKVTETI